MTLSLVGIAKEHCCEFFCLQKKPVVNTVIDDMAVIMAVNFSFNSMKTKKLSSDKKKCDVNIWSVFNLHIQLMKTFSSAFHCVQFLDPFP